MVILVATVSFFIICITAVILYVRLNPQFGGRINNAHIALYSQSKQWNGKTFENRIETNMDFKLKDVPKLMISQFTNTKLRRPKLPIPVVPFSDAEWESVPEKPKYVWYGHATLLLQINGQSILIDPMFGGDASPIGPFSVKRFSDNTLDLIDDLPEIDLVVLSHDHYDHLDYKSIQKLKGKVKLFYVALGVARHLEKWGIPSNHIKEFDWWDEQTFNGIKITFTESRHFAGRGPTDRFKSLWGGWIFKTASHNIYWSGDGGFGDHFKSIGDQFGPFDIGFMECGQYNEYWRALHMFPDEAVTAAKEARVNIAVPVHWGGFALSSHLWKHPVETFLKHANQEGVEAETPEPGKVMIVGESKTKRWWEEIE